MRSLAAPIGYIKKHQLPRWAGEAAAYNEIRKNSEEAVIMEGQEKVWHSGSKPKGLFER